jgi:hypothetical protein
MRYSVDVMRLALLLILIAVSSCICGEEDPPSPIVDAGVIGDGDPVDPDAGPPLTQDAGPVVCEEDAYEDNDARQDAVVLAQQAAVTAMFCGEDDDWFAVQAQAGCAVAVRVVFNPDDGDLDVLLYDPSGALVASGQTLGDEENLNIVASSAGAYAARVRGSDRDIIPYALTITATCPEDLSCPDDDALEDNDNASSTSALASGVAADAIACPSDEDFYAVPVDVGCIADLSVNFTDADGDIDVELRRADGTVAGASRTVTDNERVLKVVTAPGMNVRVVLFGSDTDGNAYRIRADEICEGALACPADDPFEPNDTKEEAIELDDVSDQALGVICGEDEDFFDVFPQSNCTLTADLALDTAEGDLDLQLMEANGTVITNSTTTSNAEHIDYLAPDGGRVVFRVHSFSNPTGAAQGYRLTLATTCP